MLMLTTPRPNIARHCIALLLACASSPQKLKQIHAFSLKKGVPPTNPDMGKHLIFKLISFSSPMSYPHKIFSQIQHPNIFTWNTLIRGYAESDNPAPAITLYTQLHALDNINPDTHTYPFLIKACAKLMDASVGEGVHGVVLRNGYEELKFVKNSLVHFYSVCGDLGSACKLFDEMSERDLVTWNSVINGCCVNGKSVEGLRYFKEMGLEGVDPDGFTMVSLLTACAELGALALGRRVHVYMVKVGLDSNLHAGNALVDFYAKCGSVWEAKRVFEGMELRSVVSWTSLIVGLALNGFGKEALELFGGLEREGFVPTEITFVGVLYACSHCGMVDQGFEYFDRMRVEYGITPKIEHYGCMVDLLGRAGLVEKAHSFIQTMPLEPNAVIWRTLLGACMIHGYMELGEVTQARLLQLEPKHSGDYVLLSNLYASERRWTDVQNLRKTMLKEGVRKSPGHSLVELQNCVHQFVMGDKAHAQCKEIYEKLEEIMKKLKLLGYVPRTLNVLTDIEEEEKENTLSYHSEKIAIAFVLINTAPMTPIRIVKNLRVCADCHIAIKLISQAYDREIVVRDRSRFHHFKGGLCSCKDYW